ncbi:unnamed protein product (macronuclear) [Paramecium tetraurelia]|uniref:Uncharacterized protein n=1 Tax=Paramecium tetraurelia TaxID=5888 RepID=A0CI26_PARTE|nr:uncharacterized protein GSPATT00038547001 [Paramecium tetraurelia]CAK70443.1 unnamed protein product [Paramecium tetraurelia]|eukprot:XP_001437840.1 hypothetical protein (macronuclear) [Paramecium tetraurelia strain d4-2]
MEYILSLINIQCNKNYVPFDTVSYKRALRIGSIPLTVRQANKDHFTRLAESQNNQLNWFKLLPLTLSNWQQKIRIN